MKAAGLKTGQAARGARPAHAPGCKPGQGPSPGGGPGSGPRSDLEPHGRGRDKGRAGIGWRTQQDRPRARCARRRGKAARDHAGVSFSEPGGFAHDGGEGAGADGLLQRQKHIGPARHPHEHEIAPADAMKAKARHMGNARFKQREFVRNPQDWTARLYAKPACGHEREARGGRPVSHGGGRNFEKCGAAAHAGLGAHGFIIQPFVFNGASSSFNARDRLAQKAYPVRSAAWRHRVSPPLCSLYVPYINAPGAEESRARKHERGC